MVRGSAQTGPYRFSRNASYVGLLALCLGLAVLVPTLWGLTEGAGAAPPTRPGRRARCQPPT